MRAMSTASFAAPDGTPLRIVGWPAAGTDVAVLVHHGIGEHAERYASLARGLPDVPVWSFDLRGHGQSGGRKGHAEGLDQLAADLEAILPAVLEHAGARRLILYGHSLGAASVGHYLTTRSVHPAIAAVWLSGTPVDVDLRKVEVRVKAALAPVLARALPRLTLGSGLDPHGISSVPAEVERYRRDPLVHDRISAQLGASILADAPRLLDRAAGITLPARLWHGALDPISAPTGSRRLFERLGSADKELQIVEGARHEVHHETEPITAELFAALRGWLRARGLASAT